MAETLTEASGAGLAAPQVGVLRRVCLVLDEDSEEYLEPGYFLSKHIPLQARKPACVPGFSILNGEKETGVSIMYMAKELDAGDVILQKATPIGAEEDA